MVCIAASPMTLLSIEIGASTLCKKSRLYRCYSPKDNPSTSSTACIDCLDILDSWTDLSCTVSKRGGVNNSCIECWKDMQDRVARSYSITCPLLNTGQCCIWHIRNLVTRSLAHIANRWFVICSWYSLAWDNQNIMRTGRRISLGGTHNQYNSSFMHPTSCLDHTCGIALSYIQDNLCHIFSTQLAHQTSLHHIRKHRLPSIHYSSIQRIGLVDHTHGTRQHSHGKHLRFSIYQNRILAAHPKG
jgi:hypothetical protein